MVVQQSSSSESVARERVDKWLEQFSAALDANDVDAVTALFCEDECFWRDLIAFTWNIITLENVSAIRGMLSATLDRVRPKKWAVGGEVTEIDGHTEAWLTFETEVAHGRAHLRLKDDRCWTLLTTAQALKGYEERSGRSREEGAEHGARVGREAWIDHRESERMSLGVTQQPYVVIVGGGQAGIMLGARLRRLSIPYVIVERNPRAGDSWRRRYRTLCLHDPVWYDHLPYLPFPDHWPVYMPKDRIGDWLEAYVRIMDLDYWTSTECHSASFDETSKQWTIKLIRNGSDEVTLYPTHLVLATGMSGIPNIPDVPGIADFEGDIWHSSKHPGGSSYAGKRAVVIGSNNSAHDIATDLWENCANVTMVQRSSTLVARVESMTKMVIGPNYSEDAVERGVTVDVADLLIASAPYKLLAKSQKTVFDEMRVQDGEFYKQLTSAGFVLDFGADDTGLFMKYLRRGSGYYIDTGGSQLIIDGSVKLVRGQITRVTKSAVVLDDGTELPADLVVFATGYGPMNQRAAQLISTDVAEKVGRVWGLGSNTFKDPGPWEGELRNMWKPTHQEGLWFHGGNLHQARHYSQFLGLELKARHVGIDTPVYGMEKVYHKR